MKGNVLEKVCPSLLICAIKGLYAGKVSGPICTTLTDGRNTTTLITHEARVVEAVSVLCLSELRNLGQVWCVALYESAALVVEISCALRGFSI